MRSAGKVNSSIAISSMTAYGESDYDVRKRQYPAPVVPALPVLSFGSLRRARSSKAVGGINDVEKGIFVTSARMAIALILQEADIGPGDRVLVPAFHCASMLEPIRARGAGIDFYPIDSRLTANPSDIERRLNEITRAVVVVHFFGFPQELGALREICSEKKVLLIEDCAHAPWGRSCSTEIGSVGDYAVFSLMKFFPIYDGGVLRCNANAAKIDPVSGGCLFEIRAAADCIEKAVGYRRLRPFNWPIRGVVFVKNWLLSLIKRKAGRRSRESTGPGASQGGFGFDERWVNVRMSMFSRAICRVVDPRHLAKKRRENYCALVARLMRCSGVRPIYPELPESVVPYMVPVIFDHGESVFHRLKCLGVPIYRWEDVGETECPTSREYSRKLFQLPCHQELRSRELNWMMETIEAVIREHEGKGGATHRNTPL